MRRILVVDDSPLIREVARVGLETVGGFRVATAESGREALHAAVAEPPDAILLDVVMPEMDGPATLARLRQQPRTHDVPVILVTAKDQPQDRERLGTLEVAGVIAKPFDAAKLSAHVSDILGWSR